MVKTTFGLNTAAVKLVLVFAALALALWLNFHVPQSEQRAQLRQWQRYQATWNSLRLEPALAPTGQEVQPLINALAERQKIDAPLWLASEPNRLKLQLRAERFAPLSELLRNLPQWRLAIERLEWHTEGRYIVLSLELSRL